MHAENSKTSLDFPVSISGRENVVAFNIGVINQRYAFLRKVEVNYNACSQ
eukprot:m.69609 g.69609  ORF g.69609 m.69609 type:complete len:50 (+) comp35619_c0_seq16:3345-3494(+)